MPADITVIKLDTHGQETWRYYGQLLEKADSFITLEAYFDREDRLFYGMPLCKGDRFVETYYFDRWYNIFEIHSRDDDALRGWYCNITQPAILEGRRLSYVDLALDLLVFPDGRQLVLDEEEFDALALSEPERQQAWRALGELQQYFRENQP